MAHSRWCRYGRMENLTMRVLLICLLLLPGVIGCESLLLPEPAPTSATAIFQEFWKEFDIHYALFDVHGVDWQQLYTRYRPAIYNGMPDSILFFYLDSLIEPLHDSHVGIFGYYDGKFNFYSGTPVYSEQTVAFDFHNVSSYYLKSTAAVTGYGNILYGVVNDSIGYIYLPTFYENSNTYGWAKDFENVISKLVFTKGMVIDVRGNGGGTVDNATTIASYFTKEEQVALYTAFKSGPGHQSFEPAEAVSISPSASTHYYKPVVLLTDRQSISAAEWFTLMMKTIPTVTQLGDTTHGSFSGRLDRELANGWSYSLSLLKVMDRNHISYEGKGIPPDICIHLNSTAPIISKDSILDRAIGLLNK